MKLSDEHHKEIVLSLLDKISDRITWIAERNTPHRIAIKEYISNVQEDENLSAQEKAVLTYNAKRDIKRWANTESICKKATEMIKPDASLDRVDPDWLNLFLDKAANVSTEEMQKLWADVLSRECNESETVPKALLQVMEIMGKQEAEAFMKLASFSLKVNDEKNPLVVFYRINQYYA